MSELDGVKGIGAETKKKLLVHFKSIKRIKEASDEEIAKLVGKSKASLITTWIREAEKKEEIE